MKKGFTLIELMIVVAIIAILAAVAIPALIRSKMQANEASALASLKTLVASQSQFSGQAMVDQNSNGSGEFGLFGELSGSVDLRSRPGTKAVPSFLSGSFIPLTATTFASKSGYVFQMFVPGTAAAITDDGTNTPTVLAPATDAVAIDQQEVKWLCHAWPQTAGTTGQRAYGITQTGDILFLENEQARYSNATDPLPANALFRLGEGDALLNGTIEPKVASNARTNEPWFILNN